MRHARRRPVCLVLFCIAVLLLGCDDTNTSVSDATETLEIDSSSTGDSTSPDGTVPDSDVHQDANAPDQSTQDSTEPPDVTQETTDSTTTEDADQEPLDQVDTTPQGCLDERREVGRIEPDVCSFDVSGMDQTTMNVGIQSGSYNTGPCRRESSGDCGSSRHGWYLDGNMVVLCRATCEMWAQRSNSIVIVTTGCEVRVCAPAVCHDNGESCTADIECCTENCVDETCAPVAGCFQAGSYCTHQNAEDCCSGHCDGDSCCGYLGDYCPNNHGCCEGHCVNSTCQCAWPAIECDGGCVHSLYDDNNCGACGVQCNSTMECREGVCGCDPTLETMWWSECDGLCVDTRVDSSNCGSCGESCPADRECVSSRCQCTGGLESCAGVCTDTQSHDEHCGACYNACDTTTQTCTNGSCMCQTGLTWCTWAGCVDLLTNAEHCGACENDCPGNKQCNNGSC